MLSMLHTCGHTGGVSRAWGTGLWPNPRSGREEHAECRRVWTRWRIKSGAMWWEGKRIPRPPSPSCPQCCPCSSCTPPDTYPEGPVIRCAEDFGLIRRRDDSEGVNRAHVAGQRADLFLCLYVPDLQEGSRAHRSHWAAGHHLLVVLTSRTGAAHPCSGCAVSDQQSQASHLLAPLPQPQATTGIKPPQPLRG